MFSLFQIAWQLTENPLLLYFMFMKCLLIIMNHSANTACSQAGRKIFLPQMRQVFQMWEPREGYKGSSVPSWSLRHDSGWEREMMSRPNRLPCDTTTATVRVQIHIFTLQIHIFTIQIFKMNHNDGGNFLETTSEVIEKRAWVASPVCHLSLIGVLLDTLKQTVPQCRCIIHSPTLKTLHSW